MKQTIRLIDIAKAAGVSVSSVSKALKNSDEIPPATREKIMNVARELGYRPNFTARSLRLGRTNLLGILIPDNTNSYYSTILKGIESKARSFGLSTIIANTNENAEEEKNVLNTFLSLPVDGLLSIPVHLDNYKNIKIPLVYISRYPLNHQGALFDSQAAVADSNYVLCNDSQGQFLAARHLIDCGLRQIYLFLGEQSASTVAGVKSQLRLSGFKQALSESGYPFQPSQVLYQINNCENAYQAASVLCETAVLPFGICLTNDMTAPGAISAINKHNLRIPEDVQLVGYDNIDLSQFFTPSLTTVHLAKQSMGENGVTLINDIISKNTPAQAKIHTVFEPFLVTRDSTAKLARQDTGKPEA